MFCLCLASGTGKSKETGKEYQWAQLLAASGSEYQPYEVSKVFAKMEVGMIYDCNFSMSGRIVDFQEIQRMDLSPFIE